MRQLRPILLRALVCIAAAPLVLSANVFAADARGDEASVHDFNAALAAATRTMNNSAVMDLWDDEGVTLLPSLAPIDGKKAIAKFLDSVTSSMGAARMESFDMDCHDIAVSGDWASEWCNEHQVVRFANGHAPFDGRGKMLLVLHRGTDGRWRIRDEMWNQGAAPAKRATGPAQEPAPHNGSAVH